MSEHLTVRQLLHATQQTQEWLKELTETQGFQSEEQAYSFLRAVLHAVRDRLTVNEAVHLGQQLPMMIRGAYFEGWKPAMAPNDFDTEGEFMAHVRNSLHETNEGGDMEVERGSRAILAYLDGRLHGGTLRHVKQQLPPQIEGLFPTTRTEAGAL